MKKKLVLFLEIFWWFFLIFSIVGAISAVKSPDDDLWGILACSLEGLIGMGISEKLKQYFEHKKVYWEKELKKDEINELIENNDDAELGLRRIITTLLEIKEENSDLQPSQESQTSLLHQTTPTSSNQLEIELSEQSPQQFQIQVE